MTGMIGIFLISVPGGPTMNTPVDIPSRPPKTAHLLRRPKVPLPSNSNNYRNRRPPPDPVPRQEHRSNIIYERKQSTSSADETEDQQPEDTTWYVGPEDNFFDIHSG